MAKKYLRLFLVSTATAGVSFAILLYLVVGLSRGAPFRVFLRAGAAFGLSMGIFSVVAQWLALRKLSAADRPDAVHVRAFKQVVADYPYPKAFEIARTVLVQMGVSVTREDNEAGIIVGRTRLSWKSFGEIVTVTLRQLDGPRTAFDVRSKPRLWTTLVDYGKSFRNVKKFCDSVMLLSQAPAGEARFPR